MSAGQLRIIKGRIRSVDNTKKITRAMEMVSAAKLRRFQRMMVEARPYTEGLEAMIANLIQDQAEQAGQKKSGKGFSHPFFETREEEKTGLILLTADSGLCGSYNMDLVALARQFIIEKEEAGTEIKLFGMGKSGVNALKRQGRAFEKSFIQVRAPQVEETLKALRQEVEQAYLEGRIDSLYVVYSRFINSATQRPVTEKILPFKAPEASEEKTGRRAVPYIYEPDPQFLFNRLIPVFFEAKLRMIFLESFVAEHTARMNAMHQATKNAREMIDSLVLFRNKIRQAIITKEIIEIISGSRALKKG